LVAHLEPISEYNTIRLLIFDLLLDKSTESLDGVAVESIQSIFAVIEEGLVKISPIGWQSQM
jgi:hypothetical protein